MKKYLKSAIQNSIYTGLYYESAICLEVSNFIMKYASTKVLEVIGILKICKFRFHIFQEGRLLAFKIDVR